MYLQAIAAIKSIFRFYQKTVTKFINDECLLRASSLAFTTTLSVVPLAVVCFSIISAFPKFQVVSAEMQELVFEYFAIGNGALLKKYFAEFVQRVNNLSTIGIVFLLLTAVMVMFTMEGSINFIWEAYETRQGISSFLLYWSILTLIPILLVGVFAIYSGILPYITFGLNYFKAMVPSVITLIIFFIIYLGVPNTKVPFKAAIFGAINASILFYLFKLGFTLYLKQYQTYELIYGAFSIIPIFLIWLYSIWLIVLYGAVVSKMFAVKLFLQSNKQVDPLSQVLLWLYVMQKARSNKLNVTRDNLLSNSFYCLCENPVKIYNTMHAAKLIVEKNEGIQLNINLNSMSLSELYHRVPWKLPRSSQLNNYAELKNFKFVLQKFEDEMNEVLGVKICNMLPGTDSNR